MTAKHDDAVLDAIREEPALADRDGKRYVFDVELRAIDGHRMKAEEMPERYVVLHSNRGVARPDRFTGYSRRRRKTYWVHSVGLTKKQSEAVAEKVLARLLNRRLQVEGWTCDPISHEASQPVQDDQSSKPTKFFGVDQFDLYTSPTT